MKARIARIADSVVRQHLRVRKVARQVKLQAEQDRLFVLQRALYDAMPPAIKAQVNPPQLGQEQSPGALERHRPRARKVVIPTFGCGGPR